MKPQDFEYVRRLMHDLAGNVLDDGKGYLVESRLLPLARPQGQSLEALLGTLRRMPVGDAHLAVVEAMTTKETMFFRDPHVFDTLRTTVIPHIVSRSGSVSAWCIGCSTGQEPYSLAMLLDEGFAGVPASILASDISREALARAASARYSDFEVGRGLPPPLLARYFARTREGWELTPSLRERVRYQRINLVESWPALGRMDLVLLRNVLIYMDHDTRVGILKQLRQVLAPDGWLLVGAPENLMGHPDLFVPTRSGSTFAYRPVRQG